jgi:putative restriction endonuclease
MKEGQKLWTRNELILTINLYCKIPFGKMHARNADIINLSKIIDRTPSAIVRKLGNFASFDPTLKARGIKGLVNASKLDQQIWNEFYENWDEAIIASENLLAKQKNSTIEKLYEINESDLLKEGKDIKRLVKTRINQLLFRKMVLATYNTKCCITGLSIPDLLVASHIVPWSKDNKNRLNPHNGICLNSIHDKAFDKGFMTITDDYKIKISKFILDHKKEGAIDDLFMKYDNQSILLPDKFLPEQEFLHFHQKNVFIK